MSIRCGHCKALAPHCDEASLVLKEKGIKFVSITGKNSPTKRATILEDFRKSKTHHVLIISSVGTTGLNMWFARVLVILVRLFSLLKICY